LLERLAEGGDVFHGEPQRGDLSELLAATVVMLILMRGHVRYSATERLEGGVYFPHAVPLTGVRGFPPILAQRRRLLFRPGRA